jgi:hypothetical protein
MAGERPMTSSDRHIDHKFLLGGVALLVSGLVFLGASLGVYTLNSHFSQGVLALLAGLGFLAAARLQANMRWALIPAGLFLILAAKWLISALRPGAQFMPTVVLWCIAVGFLLFFRPNPRRWWPIIPVGVLFFVGLEVGLHQFWGRLDTENPIILFYGFAVTFLAVHLISRQRVWPLIVAGVFGLLALVFTIEEFLPHSDLGPAVFMFCLGLVFLVIHLRRRRVWWPVIPGGMLCMIAVIVQLEETLGISEPWSPCLFFLGMSAIFGYLYLISNEMNKLAWARYPAVALAGVGIFIVVVEGGGQWFGKILLPIALLVAGVIYILRAIKAKGRE